MLVGQPFTIIGPLMFETGERPRTNARAMFEPLRGNTRQRSALHLIARGLPRIARNAEHRPLARAGIADDIADPARRGDMVERAALLGAQVETAAGSPRERKLAIAFGDRMASARLDRQSTRLTSSH